MRIDKLAPFIDDNSQWYNERETELQTAIEQKDDEKAAELLEIMQNREDELLQEAEKRYTESFADNPERIFQDFQEIVANIKRSQFMNWLENEKKFFPRQGICDNWAECCAYISRVSAVQLRVIEHYGLDVQKAYRTTAAKATERYEPPEQNFCFK